ncbi:MAG TPA: ribosome-associated translation inhibitor RaiA [Candidatus Saccharimonadales bacterium]|nr:ribosome-associated translation inhibitor RaiA [Candidatus Saccharimonadales bacterium]
MIQKLEINGVHYEINDDLYKYVVKKIGRLDQYMSYHARESAHAEVKLKESKVKKRVQSTCEVILHLPHEVMVTEETTLNPYAAIDIVEAKLKNQLKKYKEKHTPRLHRRILARLKHRPV